MTLGRIWLSPVAVRHNPELGPNMGPPNVSCFPIAPAELGRTDPRRTRTCRSGLHAAAARAAGSCRGPRSANAAYGEVHRAASGERGVLPSYRAFDERAMMNPF